MTSDVSIKINQAAMQHIKELSKMKTAVAKVGWFEGNQYDDGTPVAYAAAIQVFGAPQASIPPRDFMRPTMNEKKHYWDKVFAQEAKKIISGEQTNAGAFEVVGAVMAGDFRKAMSKLNTPPLSPITLQLRAWKRQGIKISGKSVGWAASLVAKGVNTILTGTAAAPLKDTRRMFDTLTHKVDRS